MLFGEMFLSSTQLASSGPPVTAMRSLENEALVLNEHFCDRFTQPCKTSSHRTADRCAMTHLNLRRVNLLTVCWLRWPHTGNDSAEKVYINSLLRNICQPNGLLQLVQSLIPMRSMILSIPRLPLQTFGYQSSSTTAKSIKLLRQYRLWRRARYVLWK